MADERETRTTPPTLVGVAVAIAAIALVTLALFPLREIAPAVSLGAVYLLAVLLVASRWGLSLAVLTAFASAAAFNFFHLAPTGELTLADPEHWVSLTVLFVAAIVTAQLAERARVRAEEAEEHRREADLSAEVARLLLRGDDLQEGLATAGQLVGRALGIPSVNIELGSRDAGERQIAFPLRDGPRDLGTVLVPAGAPEPALRRLQERVVPALESLVAAALERDQLLGDRVEAAALRRTDVLKTAILRAVSHDLRSPLTAIRTAAEPLRERTIGEESGAEMASVVIDEANKLSRLIDNLLHLSRLEAGAAEPKRIDCDLAEVIRDAIDELGLSEDDLRLQVADEMPALEADPAQLQRAIVNLLENSHRHSDGHPVMVRASGLHNRLLLRIVDRGPGITPAEQERVFEPFYRSGTEETGHRGSGLGLAIARGFIDANGGRVWVESLPGQGTSFVAEFPLVGMALGDETARPQAAATAS